MLSDLRYWVLVQEQCGQAIDLDTHSNDGGHDEPSGVVADPSKVQSNLLPKVVPEFRAGEETLKCKQEVRHATSMQQDTGGAVDTSINRELLLMSSISVPFGILYIQGLRQLETQYQYMRLNKYVCKIWHK